MSWAVGRDEERRRHIGYGVPAFCDHPGCKAKIDRGLSYACGGGVTSDQENCGLFFCDMHLEYCYTEDGMEDDPDRPNHVCARCANGLDPFKPSRERKSWARHVLTDESWEEWREDEPEWVADMQAVLDR